MRNRVNVDFTNPTDVDRLDRLKQSGENDREALSRIMQDQEAADEAARDKGGIIDAMEQALTLLERCKSEADFNLYGILTDSEQAELNELLHKIEFAGLAPLVTTLPALWHSHLSEMLAIAKHRGLDAATQENRERLQALNEELGIADSPD